MTKPEPQVLVFLVNGTRASAGLGLGALRLPAAEADALVSAGLAVYGEERARQFWPRHANDPDPEPVARPFPHAPGRRTASSN